MRIIAVFALIVIAVLAISLAVDMTAVARWAADQQRLFQNQMAGAIRALRSGEAGAYAALLGAAGAYGVVHAVGPGHGKYLIGGVGLGTSVSMSRLVGLAAASSIAQSLWAITLVYGGFSLLELTAQRMTSLAEDILAPASYIAIAAVGAILIWRGLRSLQRVAPGVARSEHAHAHAHAHSDHHHHVDEDCGCGHAHGPSPEEVEKVGSLREAAALVGSIAIRPCTGAIFLLVIAWQMDIKLAGVAAAIVMGLGTAFLTSAVAVSSVAARGVTWASADRFGSLSIALPALQVLAGIGVMWMSLLLLGFGPL